ncbi:hypothetical protein [Ensifer aridi]|uniref:hypothetical protein n=1 Tax=Ensifer aridi TaxID=1708715 RepID=UPI00358EDB54
MNHHIEKEDRHLVASFASLPFPERAARLSSSSAMRSGTMLLQLLAKPRKAERVHTVAFDHYDRHLDLKLTDYEKDE